jgi:hypothetical protein
MAVERVVICGSVPTACEGTDPTVLRLQLYGKGANVFREVDDIQAGIFDNFPPAFIDLHDIATYVYAADQATTRQRSGGDFDRGWRRRFTFHVPVRELDLWRSREVSRALTSVLSFLSEDEYHFEFTATANRGPLVQTFEIPVTVFDDAEEVVMFSGGLDSLAGAVKEVITDRRRVLLVNHRSNPKPGPRLNDLWTLFDRRAADRRPLCVRVRINKAKELSVETTQRTRSFLYAAIGATFARMMRRERIRFYENGVVSLNLPIGRQVIGAKATRTTHPRVLAGFTDLFTLLAGRPLAVENPFLGLTKTDVVKSILDAGCGELIRHSVSCAETRGRTNQHPHCGDCSQCIDRRFAVLAAGAEQYDPAGGYEIDLLTGPRKGGPSRTLLASYLDVATRVGGMTADQFAARFGEVGRVLGYMTGSPSEALKVVYDLYRRHAGQVNGVVDRVLSDAATSGLFRDGSLPPGCLVRLMSDTQPPVEPTPVPQDPGNVFQLRGQAYRVRFQGGEENILLPSKGAEYLRVLLSRSRSVASAADLAVQVAKREGSVGLGSGGKQADKEAIVAYRAKVAELRVDIEKAKQDNNAADEQQAQRELDLILSEIKRCAGVGGRLRAAADDRERIRKAVPTPSTVRSRASKSLTPRWRPTWANTFAGVTTPGTRTAT